jgi:hypothetical protein
VLPRISSSPLRRTVPSSSTLSSVELALKLLLVDLDAGDVDRSLQVRLLAAAEGGGIGLEAAAEGGDAVVGDREVDRGMDGVDGPGPRRYP